MTIRIVLLLVLVTGSLLPCVSCQTAVNTEKELAAVTQVVNDGIGWALNKDLDLLYSIVAQDDDLLIINPDSSSMRGFNAFAKHAEAVWMNPAFKATEFEVKELKITLSASGMVAWYFCILDDFGEWNGHPFSWENVRWSGVVEKRAGTWVHTQMHFSFPTES